MTRPRQKIPVQAGFEPGIFRSWGGCLVTTSSMRALGACLPPFLQGSGGMPTPPPSFPPPPTQENVESQDQNLCNWGILEANLKKCSTLKFMTNISFVSSICIHRSIVLIFIKKKYACRFFSQKIYFFRDFRFSSLWESSFLRRIPGSE